MAVAAKSKQFVAERDGVMLKVGAEIRQMYKGGAVPDGADEKHVALLKERGLLVPADDVPDDAPPSAAPSGGAPESSS